MPWGRRLYFLIYFCILSYINHAESIESHTFEHILVQPVFKKRDGKNLFLVDYTFNGFERYPWAYPDVYDRNTLLYSTDVLPVQILKLLKTSNCTYFLATIGDGHWDDRFDQLPVNAVTSGSTLIANIPKELQEHSWLSLTHGLWGLTGVSYNMASKPVLMSVTSLSQLEKTTLEGLRGYVEAVIRGESAGDVDLELVDDMLYNYERRERSICLGLLPEENLCTDNFHMLGKLLPCKYSRGLASIFSDLREVNKSQYKGARLFASLQGGRFTFSLNLQYTTFNPNLKESVKCYSIGESDIFARSAHKDKIFEGFSMPDGSYIYNVNNEDFKSLKNRLVPVQSGRIKLLFEETKSPGLNMRVFSRLSITIKNTSQSKVNVKSLTTIPDWITPLGQTLTIYKQGELYCRSEECFRLSEIILEWNKKISEEDERKIELYTTIDPNSSVSLSFTIAKSILCHYSMKYDELKGQLIPGTLLLYTESNHYPETLTDKLLHSNMKGTKTLVSNALILKTILPDHTMAYNSVSMATILLGIIIASIRSIQ